VWLTRHMKWFDWTAIDPNNKIWYFFQFQWERLFFRNFKKKPYKCFLCFRFNSSHIISALISFLYLPPASMIHEDHYENFSLKIFFFISFPLKILTEKTHHENVFFFPSSHLKLCTRKKELKFLFHLMTVRFAHSTVWFTFCC
jgi:hypothetical protein